MINALPISSDETSMIEVWTYIQSYSRLIFIVYMCSPVLFWCFVVDLSVSKSLHSLGTRFWLAYGIHCPA